MKKFLLWLAGTAIRLFVVIGPVLLLLVGCLYLALLWVMEFIGDKTFPGTNRLAKDVRSLYDEQKVANYHLTRRSK